MTGFNNFEISRRAFLAGLALTPLALSGCSQSSGSEKTQDGANATLTMLTVGTDYKEFYEAFKKENPEIEIEFESYAGYDTTDYIAATLFAGETNDIFVNSYSNYPELQAQNLVDLSGYDFANNFRNQLLGDVSIDGAIYLLPSCVSFYCPYYNKTLFEAHGWTVPKSLAELEELVPKIQEAGVQVSVATTAFPGSCMGFFWDTIAPEFSSTLEGIQWRKDFLAGDAKATGALEAHVETFQKWIDLGMFNILPDLENDSDVVKVFKEGNTAFLMTVSDQSLTQNDDGTGDQYGIMPWLSADGSNNIAVTNVRRHYGISKAIEKDKAKMDAAVEFMEFLATNEAQDALLVYSNLISPLKAYDIDEDDPRFEVLSLLEAGQSMSVIHPGWENVLADMGDEVRNFIKGEISAADLLAAFDSIQEESLKNGGLVELASVDEDLERAQVAKLVGAAFADAVRADCALISIGDFHDFDKENKYGVNGKIFANTPMTENTVCTFNPLGWNKVVKVGEVTGKVIKQWAQEGFFIEGDSEPYEYVLVTKNGAELEDSKNYKVAMTIESEERQAECNIQESGVLGQDALVAYIKNLGTINSSTIEWK